MSSRLYDSWLSLGDSLVALRGAWRLFFLGAILLAVPAWAAPRWDVSAVLSDPVDDGDDTIGTCVSISGDVIAVCGRAEGADGHEVLVYERDPPSASWVLTTRI